MNSEYVRIPEFEKLKDQHVKVIVLAKNISPSLTQKTAGLSSVYDFSDLVGNLEWQGDALAQQEALRNEWPCMSR